MAKDRQPWLRLYVDVLDNPKVQRLKGEQFKGWINLLALTKRSGGVLPGVDHIAFALRISDQKAKALVAGLVNAGLLDKTDEGPQPHDWDELQFESDSSTERVRRHRAGKGKQDGNAGCNVSSSLHETPPEAETDKETETEAETAAPDFVVLGNKALIAAGIDPARYTGSFAVVQGWLAQGHRPETILAAIKERASRPGYEPKGLDYWTKAIADFAKRKNSGSMIGEAAKPADPSKTREPTEIELEAFRLAGKDPHPLRKDGGLPKHVLDAAITNGFIPEHMRRQEKAA